MAPGKLLEEPLTRSVIGAFYEVYNQLGFGFLESLYASALERELLGREHDVMRECHGQRLLPKVIQIDSLGNELSTYAMDRCLDPIARGYSHFARPGKPGKTSIQHRRCRRRGVREGGRRAW